MAIADRGLEVVKKRKRLRTDYAVEDIERNVLSGFQIPNDSGVLVSCNCMQHLGSFNLIAAKLKGVVVVGDFKDNTFDVGIVLLQKRFNVITIDPMAAIEPHHRTERSQATHVSTTHHRPATPATHDGFVEPGRYNFLCNR